MPYLKRSAPNPEPTDCKILTAALKLFVEEGYHNVSVHEIQKQANVSIGSIYNHFGGKEGISKALYKHIVNEIEELVDDVAREISSPLEQYKEIIKQLFSYTESHSHIISFTFHSKHTEFVSDEPLICDTGPFIKIRDIIQKGMDRGEFKKTDLWVAESVLFGGAIKMIQLRLDKSIERPLPEFYDTTIETSLQGLLRCETHAQEEKADLAIMN